MSELTRQEKIAKFKKELNSAMKFVNEEGFEGNNRTFIEQVMCNLTDMAYKLKFTLQAGK